MQYVKEEKAMTETGKRLTHCLKAMGVPTGMGAAIFLTVGEENQKDEILHYMANHREATAEELLDVARRITAM